jgi:protocatechuate 3,4-dioxygenase beta subunit
MKLKLPALLFVIVLLLAGCAQSEEGGQNPVAETEFQTSAVIEEPAATPRPLPTAFADDTGDQPAAADIEAAVEPSPRPLPETAEPTSPPPLESPADSPAETIEVTYFTPPQQEGPYYPVDKPTDRDNDLTVFEGAAGSPAGQVLEFGGKMYDATGTPVQGAVIEIWQTDSSGVYLHPNDPSVESRDVNFQPYGEAVTGPDGGYSFRTILPGRYEPRPRHIHFKVKVNGEEILTSQFYFQNDPEVENQAYFSPSGGEGYYLLISIDEGQDTQGAPLLIGERDIVLNVNLSGQ